jgi:opacity protein-like surface antigen
MKHKKYHFVFGLSLLFSILIISSTNAQTSYLDSLDGKFALQFQINENFTLTNFQGTTFSGKYHLGKKSAIRAGLSISFDDARSERESTINDTLNYFENSENNSIGFTIISQYLFYLVRTDDIGFYMGSGPTIGFGHSKGETKLEISDSTFETGSGSSDNFNVGLDAIIGVEWSFHKDMTISAEYGIKFYYIHQTSEFETTSRKDKRTNEAIRLTPNYINFGISVYF